MGFFESCVEYTVRAEGRVNGFMGYVNHPRDPGGETVTGISRHYWPKWEGWPIVDELKKGFLPDQIRSGTEYDRILFAHAGLWEKVKAFYKKNFWDALYLDPMTSSRAALVLFDSCVLIGASVATWAQQITNEMGTLANSIDPTLNFYILETDGIIGPATANAMNAIFHLRLENREWDLLWAGEFLDRRERFHRERVKQAPDQIVNLAGWVSRVDLLRQKIGVKHG